MEEERGRVFLVTIKQFTGPRHVMHDKIVNINHIIPKFASIVPYMCMIRRTKFGKKRTTFASVTVKHLMDPSSRTRARLTTVLYLRGLWMQQITTINIRNNGNYRQYYSIIIIFYTK